MPSFAVGETIVRTLVEEHLIACGNLLPGAVSLYRWEGEVVREEEVLVLIKADSAAVDRVFERLAELHPYSVPELIELSTESVSRAYGRWVVESTEVPA
ncbi:MAG: divalent cation tolerance protein CutA [Gemmatimonas sp.]|nr:divalent cation tolerance protein CutA [Gemmatimonas sp.]